MLEVVIAAAVSVAAGVAWALLANAFPHADPAHSASRKISDSAAQGSALRRFLQGRLDAETVTGLALTLALVAVVLLFVVFGVAIAMIRSRSGIVSVDARVTSWAARDASSVSLTFFGWLTLAGATVVVVPAAVLTAVYAVRKWRAWNVVLFLFIVLGGQLLLSNVIKLAVDRLRPDVQPFHVFAGPSFPSGHATAAAATWAAVALVVGRGASPRTRCVLAGMGAGLAVAVACSRVFLGAHWTSDVIGGLLLGWTWFALCAVAFGGRVLRLGTPVKEAATRPAAPVTSMQSRDDDDADHLSQRRVG